MKSIYLAGPYAHKKPSVREWRFNKLNQIAGELMRDFGYIVFSPISHSHPISLHIGNSISNEFWLRQDRFYMNLCDEMWVAMLPGWKQSNGIKYETWYFRVSGKPVNYLIV